MADVYDALGLRPAINAAGTLTRLSGCVLPAEVAEAMREAARSHVRIDELQAAVGRRIAELTASEAAIVTSGAAAGLTLAAAAAIAGNDFSKMDRLPDTTGLAAEIIVPRSHRNGYDHALRAAGARLVEVGVAERNRDPQAWEIEAAITPDTVAVAYCAGFSDLPLEMVVEVAHRRALPVIVDASATLPPRAQLTAFTTAGADLVAYSGGKGLRGPQASGILCGRRELIASAALQMLDMDWNEDLWNPPPTLIPPGWTGRGVPNHGIGRAMKVGREEIAGLWAALERFVRMDEVAEATRLLAMAQHIAAAVERLVAVEIDHHQPCRPRLVLKLSGADHAIRLIRALEIGEPPIFVGQGRVERGILEIDPYCLGDGEEAVVAQRITELLSRPT
jgi:L-seryl-tRNA(Ser) seleniumtransferase